MYFLLRKHMRNKDTFLLREMTVIEYKLELLVLKDKLKEYKRLEKKKAEERKANFPCVIRLANIKLLF